MKKKINCSTGIRNRDGHDYNEMEERNERERKGSEQGRITVFNHKLICYAAYLNK